MFMDFHLKVPLHGNISTRHQETDDTRILRNTIIFKHVAYFCMLELSIG